MNNSKAVPLMQDRKVDGSCVVRYDNEPGKGDHRHLGDEESAYAFTTIDQLVADFFRDVESWRAG